MAISTLSLPIDIPWRRLAASRDMMAGSVDFAAIPLKWRTSLSIFYYQPEVDEEAHPDTRILYFKIVCSITGYQPEREELPVSTDRRDQWGSSSWNRDAMKRFLTTYHPCVGALIQVVVAPGESSGHARFEPEPMFDSFPLIVDFEPKKREVYEIVTATGEAMSQSSAGVKVTKGLSNTQSTEIGSSTKLSISGSGGSGAVGFSDESTWKQVWSNTQLDVNQADASRERRELQSYTTQLSQMYHQLDSYHLGTNRALFVVFPRPHIVPTELGGTYWGALPALDWVRKLEGIQEFFCVVEQPKANRKLCIAAHVDTMHLTSVEQLELEMENYGTGTVESFSTGRHLQGCLQIVDDAVQPVDRGIPATAALKEEYVTFEKVLPQELSRRLSADDDARVREANVRGRVLKDLLIASVNSPDRYPIGVHSFFETDVATSRLVAAKLRAADSAAERPIDIPDDLRPSLGDAAERLSGFTLAGLIGRSAADLADQLNVSAHAIQALRLAQVGLRAASKGDLGGLDGAGDDAQGG